MTQIEWGDELGPAKVIRVFAGGVICAAMEYGGATRAAAFAAIAERIRANTETVLAEEKQRNVLPRQAAEQLAVRRVKQAMSSRRYSIM